jgi:hypothetical protein
VTGWILVAAWFGLMAGVAIGVLLERWGLVK